MTDNIDIEDCFAWIQENIVAKGLTPVVPMTSMALARAKKILHPFAVQIVLKFQKEKMPDLRSDEVNL